MIDNLLKKNIPDPCSYLDKDIIRNIPKFDNGIWCHYWCHIIGVRHHKKTNGCFVHVRRTLMNLLSYLIQKGRSSKPSFLFLDSNPLNHKLKFHILISVNEVFVMNWCTPAVVSADAHLPAGHRNNRIMDIRKFVMMVSIL
jgi:hypothetical protein